MTYTLSNLKVNLTVATVDDGTRSRSEVWGDFDKLPQFVIKHTPSCLITNSGPFDIFNMAACVCVCASELWVWDCEMMGEICGADLVIRLDFPLAKFFYIWFNCIKGLNDGVFARSHFLFDYTKVRTSFFFLIRAVCARYYEIFCALWYRTKKW